MDGQKDTVGYKADEKAINHKNHDAFREKEFMTDILTDQVNNVLDAY